MSEKIREMIFEDILNINCRSVQKVLRETDCVDVAKAIKTAPLEIQNKIFNAMSERAVELLKGDIEYIKQIDNNEIEDARNKIVLIMKKLEDSNEIYIDYEYENNIPDPSVEINGQPFIFEDIIILDNQSIQKFLREIDSSDLVMALKNADESIKEKIFVNVSRRATSMLKEDIDYIDVPSKKELRLVKNKIITIIKLLESEGKIVIDRNRDYSKDIELAKIEAQKYKREKFNNGGTLIDKSLNYDVFISEYLAFKRLVMKIYNDKKAQEDEDDLSLFSISDYIDKEKVKGLDIFHYGLNLSPYTDRNIIRRILETIIKHDNNEYSRKLKYIQMEAALCIRENENLDHMLALINSYTDRTLKDDNIFEELNNNEISTNNNIKTTMSREEFYNAYLDLKKTAETFADLFCEMILMIKKKYESSELDEFDYNDNKKLLFQTLEKNLNMEKVINRDIFHYGIYLIISGIKEDKLIRILTNIISQETDDYLHRLKTIQMEMVLCILSGKGSDAINDVLDGLFYYTSHYKQDITK